MIAELYLHGLKWKNVEVPDEDITNRHILMFISEYKEDYNNTDMTFVDMHRVLFNIEDTDYEYIPFREVYGASGYINIVKSGLRDLVGQNYKGRRVWDVNERRHAILVGNIRANCDDPHVFLNREGEITYRDLEVISKDPPDAESKKIFVQRRKSIFALIDLE